MGGGLYVALLGDRISPPPIPCLPYDLQDIKVLHVQGAMGAMGALGVGPRAPWPPLSGGGKYTLERPSLGEYLVYISPPSSPGV